jgi:hypothetical protein
MKIIFIILELNLTKNLLVLVEIFSICTILGSLCLVKLIPIKFLALI